MYLNGLQPWIGNSNEIAGAHVDLQRGRAVDCEVSLGRRLRYSANRRGGKRKRACEKEAAQFHLSDCIMLAEFRLESFFAEWEFKARYHLTASDAETMTLRELLALADDEDAARWDRLALGYVETQGTPALRAAIAATYESIGAEELLCFAGAEEGLYCALNALLSAGDHAVITIPNYQSMETVPLAICDVTGIPLRPENDWELDVEEVRKALRPNTRLVAINFPHNPTGKVLSHEAFDRLVALCAERELYLFSDEVYRGIERDDALRLPQAADRYDRAFSLNVVSKAYGLPGLRVGWIASKDRAALAKMLHLKHYLSICNAAPSEVLATVALKAQPQIFTRVRSLVTENLRQLNSFFARHAQWFEWHEPGGGCVAFPRYLGADGVESFCRAVLEREGVLLLPASVYRSELGPVPIDRFRIGYGRKAMREALEALERAMPPR